MADYQISATVLANINNYVKGMNTVASVTDKTGKAVDRGINKISSAVTSKLTGIFSVAAIAGFAREVFNVTAEFQKFNAVLGTTLSSSALATIKLKEIQDFAAKTPYGISELTGAFVKLANSGFKPTGDQMRSLGDLAASTGKSFDMLAEAIIDAQTGEFERLKEFGVRAKDAGDKVIFTYKGVQTQVEKTSDAIRTYIANLGNSVGVSGSMAKISETLGGQISNLGDNWDKMLLSVGNNTTGVFNKSISLISSAIDKITQYNNELELASKYKLGDNTKDFFQQLNRAVNPFSSKGATEIELAAFGIQEANRQVTAFVSKSIDAAKSTADFGRALAELKKQGDAALKSPGIANEGERKGISDAYQLGVKAIQDARTNFAGAATASANFGTSSKKAVKSVADIMKELNVDLLKAANQFGYTFGETTEDKIQAYQKAIDELIKMGINPATDSITKLKDAQQDLFQLPQVSISPIQTSNQEAPQLVGKNVSGALRFDTIKKEQDRIKELQKTFNDDMDVLIQSGLTSTIEGISQSIGSAIANGGDLLAAAGQGLLAGFSSFLSQFGKLLVEYGAAAVLKGKLDVAAAIPGAGIFAGAAAIAAGVALQVAAAAFGGGGRTGGKKGTGNNVTAFATGAIVSGPTNALVGEYAGAKNNPEVIAPLNKLKSLIGNQQPFFQVIPIFDNKGLSIAVQRGNNQRSRT